MVEVNVTPMVDIGGVKCPRCSQRHTVRDNFDNLCDRCCHVMIEDHPNHPATVLIKEYYENQRRKYGNP